MSEMPAGMKVWQTNIWVAPEHFRQESQLPFGKVIVRSEERRVGKECRSLCDWSSDVCSSDLHVGNARGHEGVADQYLGSPGALPPGKPASVRQSDCEIGRASCRERV